MEFLANMSAMMDTQRMENTQMVHAHTEQFKNWKLKMERDLEDVKLELKKLQKKMKGLEMDMETALYLLVSDSAI